jgi:hypothetical protein
VIYEEPGGIAIRRLLTKESEGRNRFHYGRMMAGYGRIDLDYLTRLYRTSGEVPEGDFDDVSARWDRGDPAEAARGSQRRIAIARRDIQYGLACAQRHAFAQQLSRQLQGTADLGVVARRPHEFLFALDGIEVRGGGRGFGKCE